MRITYTPSVDQNRASSRYRQIIPGKELEKLGHVVYYVDARRNSEWIIINKAVDGFAGAQWAGFKKVCFDMCDNHFVTEHAAMHLSACEMADLITCSTEAMKEQIEKHTGKKAYVICDPIEFDVIAPVKVNQLDSIFFAGNNLSAGPLQNTGEVMVGGSIGINIKISGYIYDFFAVGANNFPWSFPYSKEKMLKGLDTCDVCIVPTQDDEWYRCKSHNRVSNPIARGKFVIANSIPSYEEFKPWMWIGDIAEGLDWAKNHLDELPDRISAAQDHIIKNYSPEIIGRHWENVLCQ